MDFEIDESKLLYGMGAFLGVAAIVYFGHELILDLSPTVKSFILLSGTVMFLGAAEYVDDGLLNSSFYVFSAFSYLSFLVYIFSRFSFNSSEVFLVLAASSAVFMGLGYLRSEKGYEIEREQARKLLAAVVAIVAVLVVFDVLGAQPEYSLELKDTVEISEGEETRFGVLEITNNFPLSRNVDVPRFRGCISYPGENGRRGIYLRPESPDIIDGGSTERFELTDTVRSRRESNFSISGTYKVVDEGCPEEPADNTVYITEGDDSGPVPSVVRE